LPRRIYRLSAPVSNQLAFRTALLGLLSGLFRHDGLPNHWTAYRKNLSREIPPNGTETGKRPRRYRGGCPPLTIPLDFDGCLPRRRHSPSAGVLWQIRAREGAPHGQADRDG
jgi:hypothetical protein